MNIFVKFKQVLVDHKDFFKKLRAEKTVKKSFFYYLVLTVIVFLLITYTYTDQINDYFRTLYNFTGLESFNIVLEVTFLTYFLLALMFIISTVISSVVRYWLVHLSVLLFTDVKYKDTYNSLFYSVTPSYVAWVFLALFLLLSRFSFYLALLPFVLFIAFEIYTIYIRSKGLADVHNFSFLKAFLSLYVISAVFTIILLVLLLIPLFLLL